MSRYEGSIDWTDYHPAYGPDVYALLENGERVDFVELPDDHAEHTDPGPELPVAIQEPDDSQA